jgi:hypothetical protein
MTTEYLHQLSAPGPLHPGKPRLVDESLEKGALQFCINRQHERAPATVPYVADFIGSEDVIIDQFLVLHFVQQQAERFFTSKKQQCLQRTDTLFRVMT